MTRNAVRATGRNQAELDFQIEGEMDARKRAAGHDKNVSAGGKLKAWGSIVWCKWEVRLSAKEPMVLLFFKGQIR
jgi:hypothetical protein